MDDLRKRKKKKRKKVLEMSYPNQKKKEEKEKNAYPQHIQRARIIRKRFSMRNCCLEAGIHLRNGKNPEDFINLRKEKKERRLNNWKGCNQ